MATSLQDPKYKAIIDRLKAARLGRKMNQSTLAKRLGKPQSYIAKIEGYERRLDVLEFVKIARILKVDASEVL